MGVFKGEKGEEGSCTRGKVFKVQRASRGERALREKPLQEEESLRGQVFNGKALEREDF